MPRRPTRQEDAERRRLFRQMEWTFVYGPPLLAAFFAVFGAAFLAWLVPVPGTGFWQRWVALVLILLGIPLAWQVVRWWRERGAKRSHTRLKTDD